MYKVFVLNKPIFLTDDPELEVLETHRMYYRYDGNDNLKLLIDEFVKLDEVKALLVHAENVEKLWESFRENFNYIEAAGGVVLNEKGQTLYILRHDLWDLPKGKLEEGETPSVAAVREVEEECGLSGLEIVHELPSTYHTYEHKGKQQLKRTYWYAMKTNYDGALTPQVEEAITEVKWFEAEEEEVVKANTYASILDVLNNRN